MPLKSVVEEICLEFLSVRIQFMMAARFHPKKHYVATVLVPVLGY